MSDRASSAGLFLSDNDRHRIAEVDILAKERAVGLLVDRLTEPSWTVRRAVVAALGEAGPSAVEAMTRSLRLARDDEARIAALVDALSASTSDVNAEMVTLAHDPNPAVVCDAAQVLGRRRSPAAIPLLARLTQHEDDNVAVSAIEALGRIGGLTVIEPLIMMVRSGNFFRTFPAIDVLGRSGDPRAVAPLAELLDKAHYSLEAARALGRLGLPSAVPALVDLMARGNDAVVRVAATSIAEIHARQSDEPTRTAVADLLRGHVRNVEALTSKITRTLSDADDAERAAICKVIGWIGGETAVAHLIELLDGPPTVSAAAATALAQLGRQGDEHLLAALRMGDSARRRVLLPLVGRRNADADAVVQCLDDEDPAVPALACEALARIGDPRVVPSLFPLIGMGDPRIEHAASAAIQSLGSMRTKELTLEAARSQNPRVRRSALRIIAYFGYAEGLDLLLASINEPDERIRDAAIGALPFIEESRALDAILEAAKHSAPRTRAAAMRALGQSTNSARVREPLRQALGDPDAWVRYYACQALGRLEDEGAVEAVIARLDDDAGQVRVAAVEALAQIKGERALQALHGSAASPDRDVQRAALIGLGIAKRIEALPILLTIADSFDAPTRLVAVSALAEFDVAEATTAIAAAAGDPEENVRNAALSFLAKRPGLAASQALIERLGSTADRDRILAALSMPVAGRIEAILLALEDARGDLAPILASALGRMQRPDALAALVQVLGFPSVAARRAAASALIVARDPESQGALVHASQNDPDPEVRRLCATAIAART